MKQERAVRVVALAACLAVGSALAAGYDELKVKREPVFEFAQKPVVTRAGDNVTIAYETKGFCDVTVAVEDANGRIIRHLAPDATQHGPHRSQNLPKLVVELARDVPQGRFP